MKDKLIEIIISKNKPEVKFNDMLLLVRELKDWNLLGTFNSGYSNHNADMLQYELQKKLKVTDLEIRKTLRSLTSEGETIKPAGGLLSDSDFNEVVKEVLPSKEAQVKLRDEFPFLREADCPNELKILVADRITAWENYKAAHEKIVAVKEGQAEATKEELEALAETALNSFEENRSIFEELNHYAENKTILGTHPLFLNLQLQREVNEEMTPKDLQSFVSSSPNFFSKNRKALENETNEEKKQIIADKIDLREKKLALVKKKLGL